MKFKKEKEDKFSKILIFVIVLGVSIILIFSNFKMLLKKRELKAKIESLKEKIEELEKKKKGLEEQIINEQKKEYWEEKAREEGFVKEGEEAIIIKKMEK